MPKRGVSQNRFRQFASSAALALLQAAATTSSQPILAATEIRFDTSGFPLISTDRPTTASAVSIRPDLETSGKLFTAKMDLQLISFLSETQSFSVEARDLYVATSPALLGRHQFSLGRRNYSWAKLDQVWNQGIWAPRFNWDPVYPEAVGMTGLFYRFESRRWSVTLLGSPLSVPERGAPIVERDGQLVSGNPFWQKQIQDFRVFDQSVPIRYSMVYPATSELILNPSFAASVAHTLPRGESGAEGRISFADKPIHQPATALLTKLNPQSGIIEAELNPYVLRHRLLSTEVGYRQEMGPFTGAVWGSLSREWAGQRELPANWVARDVGPSWMGAVGAELTTSSKLTIGVSYLNIIEDREEIAEASLLPPRFQFERAARADLKLRSNPKLLFDARWIHDLKHTENLVSFDFTFRPSVVSWDQDQRGWMFGFGGDFFSTATGTGWLGTFEGDDRIRGRIAYAF